MELLVVGFFLFFLALPVWVAVVEYRQKVSTRHWHRFGVIIVNFSALDGVTEIIGRYMDRDIYRSVTFKGMRYEFDRVVPPAYRYALRGRELYLEPGLVYVTARVVRNADRP